ncbi:MAG TPA: BadF/BadG/BcrA/BcrD ATPase family protein [Bacteroidota bacterium]|nr:BadF/BadG/BcrA/BcrD ATPase family protein [Bacteroidota bacterium]
MSEALLAAGIDGGATRTRAVFVTAEGTVAGFGSAGPSNYDNVGEETAAENIRRAVESARSGRRSAPGGGLPAPRAMFLGMAGVVSPTDREIVRRMVAAHRLASPDAVGVDHDIRIALAGGLEGREGVVLIAGTGSSTYGRRSDGRSHRTGWGYLLDDRGSGFFLGLQAIIATVMEADGRGPATALGAIVRDRLRFTDIDDILHIMYRGGAPVADVAALAPDVIGSAAAGDGVARRVLAEGARELARMVATVAERLQFSGKEFPVTMTGGLVDRPGHYRSMIEREILASAPGVQIVSPALPPVLGAALIALEAAGVPITPQLLARMRSEAPGLEADSRTGVTPPSSLAEQ